jgi:hypothetical protein
MKCGLCREIGHNRTTCPKNEVRVLKMPQASPDELMRLLIDPMHALALVEERKVGEALANATRRIGELSRDGLKHLACSDILIALAELELRARQISPEAIDNVGSTREAVEAAKRALAAAERAHTKAKAEVLVAIGYRAKAEEMGFRVGIIATSAEAAGG